MRRASLTSQDICEGMKKPPSEWAFNKLGNKFSKEKLLLIIEG